MNPGVVTRNERAWSSGRSAPLRHSGTVTAHVVSAAKLAAASQGLAPPCFAT
ncbi:hypothetical protein [Microbispora sp. H11081]|uniref:hypothetical protein n=1 Tax=Microbispora sp. H11081 TaxID=2729107 RepID=UPI001B8CE89F|nr:hypothetical protein [Microbispora sp. H11081]